MTSQWLVLACALESRPRARRPGPAPFPRAAASPPAPLAGTRWVAWSRAIPIRAHCRSRAHGRGRLTGFTGCNMMSGSWSEERGEARFGPILSTKRFCVGPEGDVEKRVLAAFATGTRGVREGSRLAIIAPGGARFEFSPAAAS